MSVIAKFRINSVEAFEYNTRVKASPVMPSGDDDEVTRDENEKFWKASPSGSLEISIDNPPAAEQFQPGQEWYLRFERAS